MIIGIIRHYVFVFELQRLFSKVPCENLALATETPLPRLGSSDLIQVLVVVTAVMMVVLMVVLVVAPIWSGQRRP